MTITSPLSMCPGHSTFAPHSTTTCLLVEPSSLATAGLASTTLTDTLGGSRPVTGSSPRNLTSTMTSGSSHLPGGPNTGAGTSTCSKLALSIRCTTLPSTYSTCSSRASRSARPTTSSGLSLSAVRPPASGPARMSTSSSEMKPAARARPCSAVNLVTFSRRPSLDSTSPARTCEAFLLAFLHACSRCPCQLLVPDVLASHDATAAISWEATTKALTADRATRNI
mmetsp:Transcript_23432/g.59999  ORF Transcript_23432/g.59999 Transcript_23432/m.59999 type:complete len:225 (-) Transcript_23432:27-701(-)